MSSLPHRGFTKPGQEPVVYPPLPAATLAQAIQVARAQKGWSRVDLAAQLMVPESTIDALEQGEQLWLGPVLRQRLAKTFKWSANQIEPLEKHPETLLATVAQAQAAPADLRAWLSQANATCPQCQAPLNRQRFERLDVNQALWIALQVACTQCLFRTQGEWCVDDNTTP
ncbi:MAG: hypothetical protein U0003_02575 [Vampirovibrionales bacterium]